ncbi:MAG: NAD(P)/FAD-dependent oxidoreductase [Thermoanaerobaculia bacterium]
MSNDTEIVIAGAGPAGLAVAASLRRHGLRSRILERGDTPGSAWASHYRNLRLHTSRAISELPGLRLWTATPYATREEFHRYCEDYARELALDVETRCEVTGLVREGERWRVETSHGDFEARHVVVSTGFFSRPRVPDWPGRDEFRGLWLTPGALDEGTPLAGRRVLVAGLGNTGADMIAELARLGAELTVSVRGPVHVVPLELLGANVFRWKHWLPERAAAVAKRLGAGAAENVERFAAFAWADVQERAFGDLRSLGLGLAAPEEILLDHKNGRPPVVGGAWAELLRRGALRLRPEVVRLTADAVEFAGGAREPFDAILPTIGLEESRFALAGELPSPLRDGAVDGKPGLWLCGTAPALRHIRRGARQVAAAIAAAIRERHDERP